MKRALARIADRRHQDHRSPCTRRSCSHPAFTEARVDTTFIERTWPCHLNERIVVRHTPCAARTVSGNTTVCRRSPHTACARVLWTRPAVRLLPVRVSMSTPLSRPPQLESSIRRVAILFAGGPAPAANAVISTAAVSFLRNNIDVVGILNGYSHLVEYRARPPHGRRPRLHPHRPQGAPPHPQQPGHHHRHRPGQSRQGRSPTPPT